MNFALIHNVSKKQLLVLLTSRLTMAVVHVDILLAKPCHFTPSESRIDHHGHRRMEPWMVAISNE